MLRIIPILLLTASPLGAAEFRTLAGQHIVLRTDVPGNPDVDSLPAVFDSAFEQWCKYFKIDPKDCANWRPKGILLRSPASRDRFVAAGMMPANLWDFKSGYSQGRELWLYDQTSPYYRRHLLLHEGVHCFMNTILGGSGPPWYAEGMAELLATHEWIDGKLTVNHFPRNAKEVPRLGRIEMVRQAMAEGRTLSLSDVAAYGDTAHRENEPYGWCWTAAAFLDGHPRYRQRFRELSRSIAKGDFMRQFARRFQQDQAVLAEEWQVYLANLDYGYDFARSRIEWARGEPLPAAGATVEISADRGWQSSGIALEPGRRYAISAAGRFQLAGKPTPWISEPNGVTIRYWNGRPLGLLLCAIRPHDFDAALDQTPLAKPQAVGLGTTLRSPVSGTLYLRINDAPGELADNAGQLSVTVTRLSD